MFFARKYWGGKTKRYGVGVLTVGVALHWSWGYSIHAPSWFQDATVSQKTLFYLKEFIWRHSSLLTPYTIANLTPYLSAAVHRRSASAIRFPWAASGIQTITYGRPPPQHRERPDFGSSYMILFMGRMLLELGQTEGFPKICAFKLTTSFRPQ